MATNRTVHLQNEFGCTSVTLSDRSRDDNDDGEDTGTERDWNDPDEDAIPDSQREPEPEDDGPTEPC